MFNISTNNIGLTKYKSNNTEHTDNQVTKGKLKNFADGQIRDGYIAMGAAALAAGGAFLPGKTLRVASAMPACFICWMFGLNMIRSGDEIKQGLNIKA